LASSTPLRLAHRYSTGLSWGALGGQPLGTQPVALAVQPGPHAGALV
jgi:hypothetical protein